MIDDLRRLVTNIVIDPGNEIASKGGGKVAWKVDLYTQGNEFVTSAARDVS